VTLQHIDRPPAGDSVGALVFFHGYSGDPADFVAFLNKIDPERRFHGYLPRAPHPGEGGRTSWFNRGSSDPEEKQLGALIEWLERVPHARERTVFGGLSQAQTLSTPSGSAPATSDQQRSSRLRAGSATIYRQTWNDRCRQSQLPTDAPASRSRSVSPDTRGMSLNARARRCST
jgi:hypothetical protein